MSTVGTGETPQKNSIGCYELLAQLELVTTQLKRIHEDVVILLSSQREQEVALEAHATRLQTLEANDGYSVKVRGSPY